MTNKLISVLIYSTYTNWSPMYTLYPPNRPLPMTVEAAYITTNVFISNIYYTRTGGRIIVINEVEQIPEDGTNTLSALRREVPAVPQQFPRSWQVTP